MSFSVFFIEKVVSGRALRCFVLQNLAAATRLIEVEGELRRSKDRADETQKELEYVKVTTNAEISSLREELNSKIAKGERSCSVYPSFISYCIDGTLEGS